MNSKVTNLKGEEGATTIGAGESGTPDAVYDVIVPYADTTFTTLTDATGDGAAMTSQTWPAGIPIYGRFVAVTVNTGLVRAHKARV